MLTPIVKKLVEERIQKLETNTDFQTRQIQFVAQRLEDYKTQFTADVREVVELKSFLSTLEAVLEPVAQIQDETIVEVPETRRGLSDWDDILF